MHLTLDSYIDEHSRLEILMFNFHKRYAIKIKLHINMHQRETSRGCCADFYKHVNTGCTYNDKLQFLITGKNFQ
jgi:hypothetical protein